MVSGALRRGGGTAETEEARRAVDAAPGWSVALTELAMALARTNQFPEAVAAAGVDSAVTIHLVDEVYDRGPVLAARTVPAIAGDTAEALEARVTALEPEVFVQTLRAILAGEISLPE